MTTQLDPVSQQFVEAGKSSDSTVLDIGAAFGVASLQVLTTGHANVLANDLEAEHLNQLMENCPQSERHRLLLLPGDLFSLEVKENTVDAILASRVLHFYKGSDVIKALGLFKKWLKPGGKLFLVMESPYIRSAEPFVPLFEKRLQEGDKFPGYIENLRQYESFVRVDDLPKELHLFTPETIEPLLQEAGFKTLHNDFIDRKEFPEDLRKDGRESTGVIALK